MAELDDHRRADTSPRGADVPKDRCKSLTLVWGWLLPERYPGTSKRARHDFHVVQELPALIEANFPVSDKRGISGLMGGHSVGLRAAQPYAICRLHRS
jgi:S-formylglutathione hydrolase